MFVNERCFSDMSLKNGCEPVSDNPLIEGCELVPCKLSYRCSPTTIKGFDKKNPTIKGEGPKLGSLFGPKP